MTKLYEVLTKTIESFIIEAESEEHAKRMFERGDVYAEPRYVEDYKIISAKLIRDNDEE